MAKPKHYWLGLSHSMCVCLFMWVFTVNDCTSVDFFAPSREGRNRLSQLQALAEKGGKLGVGSKYVTVCVFGCRETMKPHQ